MINMIAFSLGLALFISFSFGGMTFSQINRAFLSMHRGVFEASIVSLDSSSSSEQPYFDESLLEGYVVDYLKRNISSYQKDYSVKIAYFDAKTYEPRNDHHADAVRISIKADINTFYKYEKSRFFTIEKGDFVDE